MAQMSRLTDCKGFIADWQHAFKRGHACMAQKGFFDRVSSEQRANYESIKFDHDQYGRVPTWCNIDEYRQSVELLEITAARERLRSFLGL